MMLFPLAMINSLFSELRADMEVMLRTGDPSFVAASMMLQRTAYQVDRPQLMKLADAVLVAEGNARALNVAEARKLGRLYVWEWRDRPGELAVIAIAFASKKESATWTSSRWEAAFRPFMPLEGGLDLQALDAREFLQRLKRHR